jgi:HD superfamily phosphohydrolase YqeK
MDAEMLSRAKALSEKIATSYGVPFFYTEQRDRVDASCRMLENTELVRECIGILTVRGNTSGHGFSHARKVARDAGALVLIERGSSAGTNRLTTLAHVAGILHDIERSSTDHARRGAETARGILAGFDLTDTEREAVVNAIRNHEAFHPCSPLADPDAQLLSDALYDADKFRWGPDNFTEMLWDIAKTREISMFTVLSHFSRGMQSLTKIRESFRTSTGKRYGPNFIDLGLRIGNTLYEELGKEYSSSRTQ